MTVSQWQVDPATGQVTYTVSVSGQGQCTSNCGLALELGRDSGSGVQGVGSLPLTVTSSVAGGVWSGTGTSSGDRRVLTETTHLRAVYTDSSGSYPGDWSQVSQRYPDPLAAARVDAWSAVTATGKVTYDVTVTGATLARAGALCEGKWCSIGLEAGRVAADGTVKVVAGLTCPNAPYNVYNTWTLTTRCTATGETRPEITRIRGVISNTNGTTLTSDWQIVALEYPDSKVDLTSVAWDLNALTGKITYDVTVTGITLAKADGICENRFCNIALEAGRVRDGDVQTVASLSCGNAPYNVYNTWTLTTRCTATGETRSEITRIRAVISNTNGTRLTSGWEIVADGYPDPTLTMNVSKWENKGESAGTNAGYVDYNMSADAGGLARAAGPCETHICSLVFQGGMPDINGVIRPTSRFGSDGDNIMMPGTWKGRITNGGDHIGVIDQLYLRAAILVNGETMLTTDWQARSSLPVYDSSTDIGVDAAFVAAGIPYAALVQHPCIELAPAAPKTQESTLSDPQIECEEAVMAGNSWTQIFIKMGNKYGPTTVTSAAAIIASHIGLTRDDTPEADPLERPDFLRSVANLVRRQRIKTPAFDTNTDEWTLARNVMKQCLKVYGSTSGCDKYAIWSPGEDVDEVAAHDLMAITTGHSPVLTYASRAERSADTGADKLPTEWYNLKINQPNNCSENPYDTTGYHCDEYPYYSSDESSINADLKVLSASQNTSEGAKRRVFATTCGMPNSPRGDAKRKFIVVPVPIGAPTTGWCSR